MELQVKLLRKSFSRLGSKQEQLPEVFYEALFTRYPGIKSLFADTDMGEQRRKFARSLVTIVNGLDYPGAWSKSIRRMGKEHKEFGVLPEHFAAVGECLIYALSKVAGSKWNEELSIAWKHAYDEIARLMLEGAQSVTPGTY